MSARRGPRVRLCALAAALVAMLTLAGAAGAATVRVGGLELLPPGTSLLGALAGSTPMRVTVALRPRDSAGLARFAVSVADPASPDYRHYLTPAQFRRRFGPTAATIDAVRAALRAHGLTPGPTAAGGLSIPAVATAATLEQAFAIGLDRLRLRNGATAVTASAPPAIDRAIAADVQAIVGLSSVSAPHPLASRPKISSPRLTPHVATGGPQPCSAASGAAAGQGGLTADQIASAYGFGGLYRGGDLAQGVTVAVYELEPFDAVDVAAYQSCYGTKAGITTVPIDGGAGSGAGTGEAALDIEALIGLAPNANVLVYEAPNSNSSAPGAGPYDTFAAIVNQDRARVATVSWGQCEALEGADARPEGALFQQAAAQGQTIVSATGDSGSEDCDTGGPLGNTVLAVDDPASQPFVTGVGGTSLRSLGPPPSETVWNGGGGPLGGLLGLASGAGGGGRSALWSMPSYQSGASPTVGVIGADAAGGSCGANLCREVPDVASDADPASGFEIYYGGGWQPTGGTSAGAPLWAAVFALADAAGGCAGSPVGFANPALYRLAGTGLGRYFHDIVSGNNDLTGSHGGSFSARSGYDMASGLGSPDANALVAGLCAHTLRATVPSRISSTRGSSVRVRLGTSAGAGTRFTARGLPPGLKLRSTTGVVSGRPRSLGRYSVHLTVRRGTASSSVSFAWVIAAAPRLSGVSLRAGGLSFRLSTAAGAPGLVRVSVSPPSGLHFTAAAAGATAVGGAGARLPAAAILTRGGVQISLRSPSGRVSIRLPAHALAGRARRPRLRVAATDATGGVTILAARA